jgi:hypothetical protein
MPAPAMANQPGSIGNPIPVAWSADREARGAATRPAGPRCTAPSCAVRYLSGENRPCPDHAAPRLPLTAYQRARVRAALAVARTPARRAVVRALLAGPDRSNRVITGETCADDSYVMRVRHEMERAGLIPVFRAPPGTRYPHAAIRAALAGDASRGNRVIARLAGNSHKTVYRVRHQMERSREICVYRGGRHDPGCWCADTMDPCQQ